MTTFIFHSYAVVNLAEEYAPLQAEFERRGFPCHIIRSPRHRTSTPNQDRAKILLEALRDEIDDIALIGISNEGLFMPLVAAARPSAELSCSMPSCHFPASRSGRRPEASRFGRTGPRDCWRALLLA